MIQVLYGRLTLEINSRGLAAHAIEGFDHEMVRKNLEISDGYEIHVMITIRREDFEKIGFSKYVQNKSIERKMKEKISVSLILSKKEGMIIFPSNGEGPDFRYGFYGNSKEFLDWYMDYWRYSWATAKRFDELKLTSK